MFDVKLNPLIIIFKYLQVGKSPLPPGQEVTLLARAFPNPRLIRAKFPNGMEPQNFHLLGQDHRQLFSFVSRQINPPTAFAGFDG